MRSLLESESLNVRMRIWVTKDTSRRLIQLRPGSGPLIKPAMPQLLAHRGGWPPLRSEASPWPSCGLRGCHSLNHIAVRPAAVILDIVGGIRRENGRLNPSSPLDQVNNQHDDRNYEQEMDQTAANVAKKAKKPEHDQDNNYSPEHGIPFG